MAVYTEVSDAELEAFLAEYDIGQADSLKGVAEGVENSNYFLTTTAGQFFLTLYEKRVDPKDLPFFLGLMEHLSAGGVTCPLPVRDNAGRVLNQLAGKQAALITFLEGVWPKRPQVFHTYELGRALARMHLAGRDYEAFGLVHLDVRYRLIAVEDLFRGTIDRASVHPREVAKAVLSKNSAAVILYHNHVSGQSSTSAADEQITQHIQQVLATLDVKVVDHLIIADPIYSFAENGRL